ncbi:hypothetical protein CHLNCDRAFT_138568 [Chlorella variabilis]|uniref:Protein kinase domain-containing protein n=1 Tax=Chlorella variabilis TaxID=554065 RepID=E1ZNA8_CHLVA|nr:hypothetical protein CHLNCDRAFT_138568 [Chlorella variabilis]EFN52572.1 hypothetical protein CHLNCDRAFT_138568 [Chlorella variabilis]|eukprot:XP_005844674.1 hypothetical protein CHLNCDRAFT_138568 [Chlorella variabilis]
MPKLEKGYMAENPQLTGTLPANLPWPQLSVLDLHGCPLLNGTFPSSWCRAPFAASLFQLKLEHTRVNRQLPACAPAAFPLLDWLKPAHLPLNASGAAAGQRRPAAAHLAALLAPAAAAAAAAAAWLLRHRRWQQQQQQGGLPALHAPGGLAGPAAAAAEATTWLRGGGGVPARTAQLVGLTRRARLGALLTDVLVQQHGGISLDLLPLEGQHLAVAHSAGHSRPPSSGGRPPSSRPASSSSNSRRSGGLGSLGDSGRDAPGSDSASSFAWEAEAEAEPFAVDGRNEPLLLGEGRQAVVYRANLLGTGPAFELRPGTDPGAVWREVALMQRCRHERIVPLLGVALQGPLLLLAMELMAGGSLQAALRRPDARQQLRWGARGRQVALDVASALAFLAHLNVLHSDLSSRRGAGHCCRRCNVLLDGGLRASIGDLGNARVVAGSGASVGPFCLTHAAPEQVLGQRCTLAADVYSLGILLVELTTQQAVTRRGEWRLPRAPEECSQAVVELIEECVAQDPLRRPSAAEALQRLQAEGG